MSEQISLTLSSPQSPAQRGFVFSAPLFWHDAPMPLPPQPTTGLKTHSHPSAELSRSGLWFVLVGVAASLTHMGVFALLERRVWPELANASGFVVAFFVSFFGHRLLSFAGTRTPARTSLLRFGLTALAGFAANELVFSLLLRGLGWPSMLALVAGLAVAGRCRPPKPSRSNT